MKIKFNRIRLISALKKSKEKALEQFKKDTKEFHEKKNRALERHIENVRSYLKQLEAGDSHLDSYKLGDRLWKGTEWPSEPKKPRMESVDNAIQILELTDTEIVECNDKEQYADLTRACSILGTCRI